MRAARAVYSEAVREQLHSIGADDLPHNAAFVLAGTGTSRGQRLDLPYELGVTKQAVSQLVDNLVNRGFLERGPDPMDRRRNVLHLTERGREVAEAMHRGVEAVDQQLRQRLSDEQVQAMRAGLHALATIKAENRASASGRRSGGPGLRQWSPVFPVHDMAAALAHYSALGFNAFSHDGRNDYGFANRDGTSLHLAASGGHELGHGHGSAYLYVLDADVLYEEWSRPGIGGRTRPVVPTRYGRREGSHVDPDGNLVRFGSPLPGASGDP